MKRFISLLLIVLMLISVFSFASFADAGELSLPFADVKEGAWYYEGIEYCYNNGIVKGMTDTSFEPNGTLTRAQFVQMLAMYDGADLSLYEGYDCGFEDVKPAHWYNKAVSWAYTNGYVSGMSETVFAPNTPITREQFARILYVYAERNGCDVRNRADISVYDDGSEVSSWACEQVKWAVYEGIISGTSETALSPRSNATRAQACRMIMTFDGYFGSSYVKNDIFYLMVDYILANGTVSTEDTDLTEIVEKTDGEKFVFGYEADHNSVYFIYYTGGYEITDENGDTRTYYTGAGRITVDDIYESYILEFFFSDKDQNKYAIRYSKAYPGGIVPFYGEGYGYSDAYIDEYCDLISTELNSFIIKYVEAMGIRLEDMFLHPDYDREGAYKILADYITDNGTEGKYGEYTYAIDVQGLSFFADYSPVSGEIIFRLYDTDSVGDMTVNELGDAYGFNYYYADNDGGYILSCRTVYEDGNELDMYDYNIDEETAHAMEEALYSAFCEGVKELLKECGLTVADLYE